MRKTLMVVVAVSLGSYSAYRWQASAPAPTTQEHEKLLKDRVWIDHMPKNERDKLNVFVALTPRPRQGPQGPFGIFESVSMWEGHFEAFRYESQGGEMRIVFGQTGDKETLTVKASKCDVQGMDYCLDISGNSRGVGRYYSKRGWEVRTVDEAHALTTTLAK